MQPKRHTVQQIKEERERQNEALKERQHEELIKIRETTKMKVINQFKCYILLLLTLCFEGQNKKLV